MKRPDSLPAFDGHKKRVQKAWSDRSPFDRLYGDAYDYALPQRRPSDSGRTPDTAADLIFDMTATMSSMYFAGSLSRDLFSQDPFTLQTGKVARLSLDAGQVKVLDRELAGVADRITPFFQSGDWDNAKHEACIDLGVGTAAILPVKGPRNNPVLFAALPFDQIAIECDMFGRPQLVSWKQTMTRDMLRDGFPNGDHAETDAGGAGAADSEITVYQDWFRVKSGGWLFVVWTERSVGFVEHDWTRTQPIAVPRYYRVPGEAYGRGPILLALPSIKTLNKAQELTLRAAAIQMLGIWAYRAGGTFNPDTVALGPGQFWPMQSTGGILGPDVQRLDPATGRLDVASLVTENLQGQIKGVLFDNRIDDKGGTPASASEIVARMRQQADVHIGAFGRLVREIMPVIVPRVSEILFEHGYLGPPMTIDEYLVAMEVQSPMQAALNASKLTAVANYLEFAASIAGPERLKFYAHLDRIMELVRKGLQVPLEAVPTDAERRQYE
ncbi:MAG: hypothetical protein KDJ77_20090, partial [Rhodobiaceae bacterium]|nr:hypothetical protein [Rhodobiaceae bacterium]